MPATFWKDGKQLTVGQALDLWLAHMQEHYQGDESYDLHFFADAAQGFHMPMQMVKDAGIEIIFEGQMA